VKLSRGVVSVLITIAIASAVVCGVAPTDAQTQDPATVDGIVTRTGTTTPIPGAMVTLTAGTRRLQATTDQGGKFAFSNLPPGNYLPTLAKTGFTTLAQPPGPAVFVRVAAGQHVRDLKLDMLALSAITGKITDQNGDPAIAINVSLLRPAFSSGDRLLASVGMQGVTDDQGQFRIFNLQPGDYILGTGFLQPKRNFAPTYFPGVGAPQNATTITVPPGQDVSGLNMTLWRGAVYSVRFKVAIATSIPNSLPLRITTRMRIPNGYGTPLTGDSESVGDDTYVVRNLAAGSYEINVTSGAGYGDPEQYVQLTPTITDRDVDLGTINIGPIRTLTGRIIVPDDLRGSMKLDQVILRRWDSVDSVLPNIVVPVGADGTFNVDLPEGRYRIVSALPAEFYVKSVRYGSRDVVDTGLVMDGGATGQVEVGIAQGITSVEGIVHNTKGELVYGAKIALLPASSRRTNLDLFFTATTDTGGNFSISRVPPGEYSILALESLPREAVRDSEYMKQFEKQETKITVGGGVTKQVDLVVIPNFKAGTP